MFEQPYKTGQGEFMAISVKGINAKLKVVIFAIVAALVLSIVPLSLLNGNAASADTRTATIEAQYGQSEARQMIGMINDFRTGNDSWYWNSDNTTKTYNNCKPLVYDYDLEKVAMQRAAEIAVSFAHERPNGEKCFTAYPANMKKACMGENIAAGQKTADKAFKSWLEASAKYDGQGHRRNMLDKDYVAVGVAHVVVNGTHYWVQEFGGSSYNTKATQANNGVTNVDVEIANSKLNYIDSNTATVKGSFPSNVTVTFKDGTPTVAEGSDGWYYFDGSHRINYGYTGIANNDYGWWRIENGKVNFSANSVYQNEFGWWKVEGGAVNFAYNGVAQNDYGWWKITNGAVEFNYTGLAQNEYGWWYIENGAVNFNYSGIVRNQYGKWLVQNGGVNFGYNGTYRQNGTTYRIVGGQAV